MTPTSVYIRATFPQLAHSRTPPLPEQIFPTPGLIKSLGYDHYLTDASGNALLTKGVPNNKIPPGWSEMEVAKD